MADKRTTSPVIAALGGGIVCVLLGEFAPFTGGFLVQHIAEPFSPVRNQVAMGYAVVGAVIAAVLALLVALSARRKNDGG